MAAAMMSAGVPHQVAWPAANGNAAALAATQSALEVLQANMQAFSEISDRMMHPAAPEPQPRNGRSPQPDSPAHQAFASTMTAPMEMALTFQRLGNDMFATWCGMAGGSRSTR